MPTFNCLWRPKSFVQNREFTSTNVLRFEKESQTRQFMRIRYIDKNIVGTKMTVAKLPVYNDIKGILLHHV